MIPAYLRAYNDASTKFRNLLFDRASDDRWCWVMDEQSSRLTLWFDSEGADFPPLIQLVSHAVRLRELVDPQLAGLLIIVIIAAAVALVALYRLLESTLNRFFGLDQPDLETAITGGVEQRCEAPQTICGRRLLIRPDAEDLEKIARLMRRAGWIRVIDLRTCPHPGSLEDCREHALKNLKFLLVLHLDYHRLTDQPWRQAILELLEWIVLHNAQQNVTVVTDVDLLPSLFALGEAMPVLARDNGGSDHDDAVRGQPGRGELARWSELFLPFRENPVPVDTARLPG